MDGGKKKRRTNHYLLLRRMNQNYITGHYNLSNVEEEGSLCQSVHYAEL